MKLFDLHCDTATRLYYEGQNLKSNNLHISLDDAQNLKKYAQIMAVWTNHRFTDSKGYDEFFKVIANLENEVTKNSDRVAIVKDMFSFNQAEANGIIPLILSVEDARILENDLSRLDVLKSYGVKTLTLNWYGNTCIGGAHDTKNGLTEFGKSVVERCFQIGIIPDISHCSFEGAEMALDIAKEYQKPLIASHSDSYTINPHSRNLRDKDFIELAKLGGLVGINLCPSHLSPEDKVDISEIINHIEHYLSLSGENVIAMGCDLDGTDLPYGFCGIRDIDVITDIMRKANYSDELIDKIMYKNAFEFFKRNF